MLALGSVIAGLGVLLVGLLALLFRHPRAPGWTRPEAVLFLSTVPVAGMIGLGLGYMLFGASALLRGEGDGRELAALILMPVVVAPLGRGLGIGRRLRAYAATSGAGVVLLPGGAVATPSTEQPPESPAPGKPPRRPTRKAA
jgi:GNAT superfamily N-acetyltransferase